MATRAKDNAFVILGQSPSSEDLSISGQKLPTNKQILLCLLAHIEKLRREDLSKNKKIVPIAIKLVEEEALAHYRKAAIPFLTSKQINKRILALYEKFQLIRKLKRGKVYDGSNKSISEFRIQLTQTMPLYPKNAIELMLKEKKGKLESEKMSIDEDIEFLKNMMTTRTAHYASLDKITTNLKRKRGARKEKDLARAGTSRDDDPYVVETSTTEGMADLAPGDTDLTPIECSSSTPPRRHRRLKKTGEALFIPHDILQRERIVSNYTRNNMSITTVASFLRDLIVECGGDPDKFVLNYATVYE